jgi:hypothetical protein
MLAALIGAESIVLKTVKDMTFATALTSPRFQTNSVTPRKLTSKLDWLQPWIGIEIIELGGNRLRIVQRSRVLQ